MEKQVLSSFLSESKIKRIPKQQCTELQSSYFIGQLISNSESYKLEFKNYGWPFVQNGNYNIEFTLLKTICSFLNRSGGTLLIGVDDEQQIQGIQINSVDEVKRYFDMLKKKFFPNPQGLIKTVEIPLKQYEGEDFESYNWVPNKYVIRVEVSQGELDRLYTFSHQNLTYYSFREDASICTTDKIEDIQNEIYQKALRPNYKSQPIIYQEPDQEGLSESQNIVLRKKHQQKYQMIVFSNIFQKCIKQFVEFVDRKLQEKGMKEYEIVEFLEYLITIRGERLDKINQALQQIFQENEKAVLKMTHKSQPLQYGLMKNTLSIKQPYTEEQFKNLTEFIKDLELNFRVKENKEIQVIAQKQMEDLPVLYTYCKLNQLKVLVSYY